jgi:SepF-like predicted cell division protein (DUF552 family)
VTPSANSSHTQSHTTSKPRYYDISKDPEWNNLEEAVVLTKLAKISMDSDTAVAGIQDELIQENIIWLMSRLWILKVSDKARREVLRILATRTGVDFEYVAKCTPEQLEEKVMQGWGIL